MAVDSFTSMLQQMMAQRLGGAAPGGAPGAPPTGTAPQLPPGPPPNPFGGIMGQMSPAGFARPEAQQWLNQMFGPSPPPPAPAPGQMYAGGSPGYYNPGGPGYPGQGSTIPAEGFAPGEPPPGTMPQAPNPAAGGDMMYAGGSPGFYAPGGAGYNPPGGAFPATSGPALGSPKTRPTQWGQLGDAFGRRLGPGLGMALGGGRGFMGTGVSGARIKKFMKQRGYRMGQLGKGTVGAITPDGRKLSRQDIAREYELLKSVVGNGGGGLGFTGTRMV